MKQPSFSVIVPFLNAQKYLEEAIISVVRQDCPDWELLLVDDASTDGGPEIAKRWSLADPRIAFLERSHARPAGAAAARNRGIRCARGEFLAFLDADDIFLPDRLSSHLAVLTAHPGLIAVYGRSDWLFEPEGTVRREYLGQVRGRVAQAPDLVRRIILNHEGDVPCTCSVTFHREEVIACGGFDESFHLYEDQTLWVKIFARHATYVLDQCGAIYRQHSDSVSAAAIEAGDFCPTSPHSAGHDFLVWIEGFLAENRLDDPKLDRALAWHLSAYRLTICSRFCQFPARSILHVLRRFLAIIRNKI